MDEASNGLADKKKSKSKESKKGKKKAETGPSNKPMHFTANNEPRAVDVLGDLDPNIFNECKEQMRPVKKALKALGKPDQTLSAEEQVTHTRTCLVNIGNQINACLAVIKDPNKIKEWRSNLWYFVSKFTDFDAKKLFKLYKVELKKSELQNSSEDSKDPKATSSSNNHHSHHKKDETPAERKERKEKKSKHHHKEHKEHKDHSKDNGKARHVDRFSDYDGNSNDTDTILHAKRKTEKEEGEIDDTKEYKKSANER